MKTKNKQNLVVVSAKIPQETRQIIEKKAENEDRSLSQTISRLLLSHPELKTKKQLSLQS